MNEADELELAKRCLRKILDTSGGGYVDLGIGVIDTRLDFTPDEIAYLTPLRTRD